MAELKKIGAVEIAAGSVSVRHPDGTSGTLAKGAPIYQGDLIETGADGRVGVVFVDKSSFSLGPKGRMSMDEMVYDPANPQDGHSTVAALGGAFSFVSGQIAKAHPDAMVIKTPVLTIGVRGTSGAGRAAPEGSENTVTLLRDGNGNLGEIVISNAGGSIRLNAESHTIQIASYVQAPSNPRQLSAAQIEQNYGHALEAQPNRPAPPPENPPPQENNGGNQEGGDRGAEQKAGPEMPTTPQEAVQFVTANLTQLVVQEPVLESEIGAILEDLISWAVLFSDVVENDFDQLMNEIFADEWAFEQFLLELEDFDAMFEDLALEDDTVYWFDNQLPAGVEIPILDEAGWDTLVLDGHQASIDRLLRGAEVDGDDLVLTLGADGGTAKVIIKNQFAGAVIETATDNSGNGDHYLTLDGVASSGNDLLVATEDVDAGAGDDMIVWSASAPGNVVLEGGDGGDDEAKFWNYTPTAGGFGLKIDLTANTVKNYAETVTVALLSNIEDVTGSTGDDVFTFGSSGGGASGFGGNDTFNGSAGGWTKVDYSDNEQKITVATTSGTEKTVYHGTALTELDALTDIDGIIGTDFDDDYTDTNSLSDWFAPGAGNDTFTGGNGYDTVNYDDGPTTYWGLDVDLDNGTVKDIYSTSGTTYLDPWGYTDAATGVESVRGTDNADHMRLVGGSGDLHGGAGNDTLEVTNGGWGALNGGKGDDELKSGGTGSVTLVGGEGDDDIWGSATSTDTVKFALEQSNYSSLSAGIDRVSLLGLDTIREFDASVDSINLYDGDFGLGGVNLGTNLFTDWSTAGAHSGRGIVLDESNGDVDVWFCEDLSDQSTGYQIATVVGVTAANLAPHITVTPPP